MSSTAKINLIRAHSINAIDYVRPAVTGNLTQFKAGDIISCMAGNPKKFVIIELTGTPTLFNYREHLTEGSNTVLNDEQLYSHNWSLMTISKPDIIAILEREQQN